MSERAEHAAGKLHHDVDRGVDRPDLADRGSATVTAGLKCAPEMIASVWISTNSTNTCTRPITAQSWNGWSTGVPGGALRRARGPGANSTTDIVTKKTRKRADELGHVRRGAALLDERRSSPRRRYAARSRRLSISVLLTATFHVASLGRVSGRVGAGPARPRAEPAAQCSHTRERNVARMRLLAWVLLPATALAGCGEAMTTPRREPQRAVLALDFSPNAVHAGVYQAVEGGHDRRSEVRLEVRVPTSSSDSLQLLATRRADLAILDIHDLGLARQRGSDLVGVGAIVQRPLSSVIARSRCRGRGSSRAGAPGSRACPRTTRCCAPWSRATAATSTRCGGSRSASARCRA